MLCCYLAVFLISTLKVSSFTTVVIKRPLTIQRERTVLLKCIPRKIAGAMVSFGFLISSYNPLAPTAAFAIESQTEKRKVIGKTTIEGEASRIFRKALQCESDGDLKEAQNFYEQVIGVEPDFVFAWSNLGNVLTSRGNLDQALLCYRKAISLYPPQESLAVIILNKASIELSTGRNKDALRDLEAAEKLAGPLPPILTNKAVALTNEGRWPEACDLFERVISSADRDALPWWLRYSMALLESSRGTESVAYLQRTLNRYPEEPEAKAFAVALYSALGTKAEAGRYWQQMTPSDRDLYLSPNFITEKLHWGPKAIKNWLDFQQSKYSKIKIDVVNEAI